jgi:hypothetical protein
MLTKVLTGHAGISSARGKVVLEDSTQTLRDHPGVREA